MSLCIVSISDKHPERTVRIGAQLSLEIAAELTQFLKENAVVFAWSYADMPGISPNIIQHKLSIKPSFYPVKQKRQAFDEERYREEVTKLRDIDFIRQVHYPQWISNMNAGATYQRLMNAMFAEQLGKIIEVYVDDMLVKSVKAGGHVANLRIILAILLAYGMRLNPEKCFFGVTASKFLGYIVSERGIEANPNKVQAVINMKSPEKKVEVQSLQGKLTALSRFISRLTDKCLPFFKAMKRSHCKVVDWTPDCEVAFQNLKEYLASVPLLSTPVCGEILYIYLVVSKSAISCAIVHREATEHSGRLSKWAIELSELYIDYKRRTAIRGQAVIDFIAELTESQPEHTTDVVSEDIIQHPEANQTRTQSRWNLYVDGSACSKACGAAIILAGPGGLNVEYALKFDFKASNNMEEYQALIDRVKDKQLAAYLGYAKTLLSKFSFFNITQIPCEKNAKADSLAHLATAQPHQSPAYTRVETIDKSNITKTLAEIYTIDVSPNWMDEILNYKCDSTLPFDKVEARRLARRATRYNIQNGKLYRQGKWIEAEPLTAITTVKVQHFLWKNIYCRYGVPDTIITDNGTQFNNEELINFTAKLGTKMRFTSVAHLQTNGQVESANKILKKLLKKKLEDKKGLWAEKIPEVLWAIRTTPTSANGETPFCMMFGTEAVLPIEVTEPTTRIDGYDATTNVDGVNLGKDLLEEK
ncbi:uncharacterized protein LOC112171062 [Rosa chinensis]|uniref:uncharacterized protein LOC112171062 n=1 Tax=Rosa chinensis TaxID=74649 RepID=UPI000D08A42F|nr:uncharacterized protein LOC112171062 [Rosa chinensis]